MAESESRDIFPVIRFRSLNYVFEAATSLRVMMNLLALPTPYLSGSSDQYPHSGHVPADTYRTPWVKGNVISTCKLFLNDSGLDDLRKQQQSVYAPESYKEPLNYLQDVIPSSNPDSLNEVDIREVGCVLMESKDPCQEAFLKMPINKPEKEKKEFFLREELVEVDYLKQFKSHLPSLKTKLSRLKTLPVADPLFGLKSKGIYEDAILRHYEPYEMPSQMHRTDNVSSTITFEDFSKEQLNDEESLGLPSILETFSLTRVDCSAVSNICNLLTVTPEEISEQHSCLEIMQNVTPKIFQVETYKKQNKESLTEEFTDAESAGQIKSPVETELDLTLSPVSKDHHISNLTSTSGLYQEELSPIKQIALGSSKAQGELEMALWTAEKHPDYVLKYMLTEPQSYESTVDFQPLSEAMTFLKSKKQCFVSFDEIDSRFGTGVQQMSLCNSCDFTETLMSHSSFSKTVVEEFKKMSPEQDFSVRSIPNISTPRSLVSDLTKPEEPTLNTENNTQTKNERLSYPQTTTVNVGKATNEITSCPEPFCNTTTKDYLFTSSSSKGNRGDQTTVEIRHPQPNTLGQLPVKKDNSKCLLESKCQPHKELDPLSTFMMLRSQQTPTVTATPPPSSAVSPAPDMVKQRAHYELQSMNQSQSIKRNYMNAAISRNASREQSRVANQPESPQTTHPMEQHITPDKKQESRVLPVQATESQCRAYSELLHFVGPHLSIAQQLGLNMKVWGDFRYLTLDQTHFLVKQQEKALCGINSHNVDLVRDQEQLFNKVTLIHVLVTFKELLLKCGLSTGVEYLKRTTMVSSEKSLNQLLKRLQIILYLSHKKQESNPKLLDLQGLLKTWSQNRTGNKITKKILIIITNDCDNTRSVILSCLSQVTGPAVANLHHNKDKTKLNGASVVSSLCNSVCALVCEQHIGPDFPWQCFSLVVEYEHPGQSPWATVCRERGLAHVTFNTILPDNDRIPSQCLEDSVSYVLLVTERLLNCPLLLQTLESTFNITVFERNHCATLQMLGGTHQYAVITVDESTAIVLQRQEELCQERASEGLVMRLTALSLQYSCCWLILYCPDSQGGGHSSEAFNNLLLVYSSLVLFSMKSEDLDVKVLMVSEVVEVARWISQISFYNLMNSDKDPASYLDREWLTVIQSNEEKCLLHFPSINPLVSQLMLRRAPNIQWLLGAPLSQLKEMFPEVPHKVLKLFNDTTSLYTQTTDSSQAVTKETNHQRSSNTTTLFNESDPQHLDLSPQHDPFFNTDTRFLFGSAAVHDSFCDTVLEEEAEPSLRFKMSPSFLGPDVHRQKSWTISDLWKDDRDEMKQPLHCGSRAGAIGKIVARDDFLRPLPHNTKLTHSLYNSPFKAESTFSYNLVNTNSELQQMSYSSPVEVTKWGQGLSSNQAFPNNGGMTRVSYGSKSFVGQERKRSSDRETLFGAVPTPLKRNKLSYEKVPGRSDGQTRLKLF